MSFKHHEDYLKVQELLVGRKIAQAKINDDKVLLKFDNQDLLEIETDENPFSTQITATFTEWVDDETEEEKENGNLSRNKL